MKASLLCSVFAAAVTTCFAQQPVAGPVPSVSRFGQLQLTFEANQGQTDPYVNFVSRGKGYTAFVSGTGIVLSLRPSSVSAKPPEGIAETNTHTSPAATLQLSFVGGTQHPLVVGEEEQPGKVNYFIGNDPGKWHTNVPTYARVRSKNVYPGIDLLYYGNNHELEYDLQVSPGADATKIELEVKGATDTHVDADGTLVLKTSGAELRFDCPVVYQESNGKRVLLNGGYVQKDATHILFQVSAYDRTKPLVIDPALNYSTYLGGTGDDSPQAVAIDSQGNTYVAGYTDSVDFPLTTLGSLPPGVNHVFVAKLDASGSNLVYADYLGGNGQDYGYGLAVDSTNSVYVTGSTASSDFPMMNPFQGTYPGAFNAFLTKISPSGSSLLYSTYFGGNGSDIPINVAVDALGDMIIGGYTSSTNLPVNNAYQPTVSANGGGLYGDYGFLTKFAPDGGSLVFSTYFAGNSNVPFSCGGSPCWPQPISLISGLTVDLSGNVYIAGSTNTYNFPVTVGAYMTTDTTQMNATVGFLSKFNTGGGLQYSTYFYESSGLLTGITAIAVDGSGSAYVTGVAISDGTFPITSTSICDPGVLGWACSYAFVSKFDTTGSTLLYSTFLGPNNGATPRAIVLDSNNDAYVLASTTSTSFSTVNGIEGFAGGNDVLLVEIDPAATMQLFATYLGGNADDEPAGMALDGASNLYVAVMTNSADFPVTQSAFQPMLAGNYDAFILKISTNSASAVAIAPNSLQFPVQSIGSSSSPQTAVLHNMGNSPLTISSVTTGGDFSETNDCGTSVPAAGYCAFSVTFTPTAAGVRTGAVFIQDNAAGSPHLVHLSGSGSGVAAATLTPAAQTFSSQPVGTSSSTQPITLASTGNIPLNLTNLQITGDFSQVNNCPAALAPGSHCTINVAFTPTAVGGRTGTLTLNTNAQNSPQVVTLSGTGSDFSVTSSPGSVNVKAGSPATYTITIASVGGAFASSVKVSANGVPASTTYALSPASVTPGASSKTVTLTVNTTATVAAGSRPAGGSHHNAIYAVCLQLPGMGLFGMFLPAFSRRRKKLVTLALLSVLMFMSACAGGTGMVPTPQPGTAPGTYTITVTGTSGGLQHSLPLTLTVQ